MNFSKYVVKLHAQQVLASADEHPKFITESHITDGEILHINESDTKYQKSDKNVRDVDKVNKSSRRLKISRVRGTG